MVDSCVILMGEGLGESGVKSIGFITSGVVIITFFNLPCFSSESTNRLNWVSTNTLFALSSSRMLTIVASSSSSSFDSYKISLRFPFPFP